MTFEEVWAKWPRRTARAQAERDWFQYVNVRNSAAVDACVERYLASREVERGMVRTLGTVASGGTLKPGWLADCAADNWECSWPPSQKAKRAAPRPKRTEADDATARENARDLWRRGDAETRRELEQLWGMSEVHGD